MSKILIVEDDPFILKMYQKKFTIDGFEVSTATNGADGLAKIKSIKPDLVLMDIMMPKLNGIDALEKAKADPDTKNIPILILTNLSSADDAKTAKQKGALDYLIKSQFTPAQIVAKAKSVIKK